MRWEPEGVGFLAVSVVAERARVEAEVKRLGFDLPMAVTTGNLLEAVGIDGVPTTLFVSRQGRIVGIAEGAISAGALERAISEISGT